MSATATVQQGTMKAVVFHEYGSPDVLKVTEIPIPAPRGDEVLVKIHAASVNSWDWELLSGLFLNRLTGGPFKPRVKILGADIAGRAEAVGSNVNQFQPGDEVYGDISHAGWGGFAEYVSVRERALAPKSASVSFEGAAAVPQAAVLALQGLRDNGRIQPGQKVLINGAGGGMGTFALQIAKSVGTEVTGVDSTEKLDVMRAAGADHVIDYTKEDFTNSGRRYDLILDAASHRSIFDNKRALSPNGKYVMVGGSTARILQIMTVGPMISRFGNKKTGILIHKPNSEDLVALNEMLESGSIVPIIDRTYPLHETAEALRYFGGGHAKGKIVITV